MIRAIYIWWLKRQYLRTIDEMMRIRYDGPWLWTDTQVHQDDCLHSRAAKIQRKLAALTQNWER